MMKYHVLSPLRGVCTPFEGRRLVCMDLELRAPGEDEKSTLVRIGVLKKDEGLGWFENRDRETILTPRQSLRLGLENRTGKEVALMLTLENSTSTVGVDEAVVVIDFFNESLAFSDASRLLDDEKLVTKESWIERRCPNEKTYRFSVKMEHWFCQSREGYRDEIVIGKYKVVLKMFWKISHSNLAREFAMVSFDARGEGEEEQKILQLENSIRRLLVESRSKTGKLVLFDDAINITKQGPSTSELMSVPSLLECFQDMKTTVIASLAPNLLRLLDLEPEVEQQLSSSNIFIVYVVILAKVCGDDMYDRNDLFRSILDELVHKISDRLWFRFYEILMDIVLVRQNQDKIVVLALCMVGLVFIRRNQFKNEVERIFSALMKQRDKVFACMAMTRLFPACLAVVDPSIVARDVKLLFLELVESGEEDAKIWNFFTSSTAHLFQQYDHDMLWAREVMPSVEAWVHLHLFEPSFRIATHAMTQFHRVEDCSDGFDVLITALYERLRDSVEKAKIHKFDVGPMTPEWALGTSWDFFLQFVELTCVREYPINPITMSYLQLLAKHHVLQGKLYRGETMGKSRRAIDRIFRATFIHTSSEVPSPLSENDFVPIVVQLLDMALGTGSALSNDTHEEKEMWQSSLVFLLFAARSWDSENLGMLKHVMHLIQERNRRTISNPENGDITQLSLYEQYHLTPPWYAQLVIQGLTKICLGNQDSTPLLDIAIETIHHLLMDQSCVRTIQAECKLAVFNVARTQQTSGKGLDRWIVHMEDLSKHRALADDMFALRALGSALSSDNATSQLFMEAISHLLGRPDSIWIYNPLLPPHFSLLYRSHDTSNIKLLVLALELQRSAVANTERGNVFLDIVGIQIQVQLQLCQVLDDLGKDVLVRNVEKVVHKIGSRYCRLGALCLALVEDALKEDLGHIWAKLLPIIRSQFSNIHSSISSATFGDGIPLRRHVVFNAKTTGTWGAAPPNSSMCLEELRANLIGQLYIDWMGHEISGEKVETNDYNPDQEICIFQSHYFENGVILYCLDHENKNAWRIELTHDEKKQRTTDVGRLLLPESFRHVKFIPVATPKACAQFMVLVISNLKSYLEHNVWLERYDNDMQAQHTRVILHELVTNEIIDTKLNPMYKVLENGKLLESFGKIVDIAMESLEKHGQVDLLEKLKSKYVV